MITWEDIYSTLKKAGIKPDAINGMDSKYSIPTQEWVLNTSTNISEQIKSMLGGWIPEARDCDDFAIATFSLMRLAHSKSNPDTSLAVGYFQYYSDKLGGYHAINIVFINKQKIMFFEPQTGDMLPLTTSEIKSCTRLLI